MMERAQEKLLKWLLGVNRMTPGYMIKEELQGEKLRTKAGRRTWRSEEILVRGRESELARKLGGGKREGKKEREDVVGVG